MKTTPNCKHCKDRFTCSNPCDALLTQLKRDFPLNINVNASPAFPVPDGPREAISIWDILSTSQTICHLTDRRKIFMILTALRFSPTRIAKVFKIKRKDIYASLYSLRKKLIQK